MSKRLWMVLIAALVLAACGAPAATPSPTAVPTTPATAEATAQPTAAPTSEATAQPTAAPTAEATPATSELRQITLAMSYIPNIQFAPYYVAAAKGYYAEAGLEVIFDYNFENDVVTRVGAWPESKVEFATASGTSTLLARQSGLPVKTVMTLYQQFPVVFFAKSTTGLQSVQDLKGKTVGIPGRFGESLYALMAILYANQLDESVMTVQEIGFTQAQSVLEDNVQVGIGYGMNEPVLLRQQGVEVDVLRVADVYDLASNGIVVSEALIEQDPELVRAFMLASLRGLADTLADPDAAFTLSLNYIPEAQLGDVELQRQVLTESLPYWTSAQTETEGLGFTNLETWVKTEEFMRAANLLTQPVEVSSAFTNEFIK
ncbi:NMT1/THI5-like domain-containing protein [Oscillochloris trichoides DG-6]|uniref:NMT1/THI5-like domain-containing protein n=1 Tax=Oscillochloris trichoides DG-6 TaxID=765420 RepID=E1IAJ7_9CHLR|nr:ABC transporter substrate-binding protein [Oscillochloris trichoides]EFO81771.1 NMT1/THI5-like domain-containing protein [Oscillochloris trichoides DG-6]